MHECIHIWFMSCHVQTNRRPPTLSTLCHCNCILYISLKATVHSEYNFSMCGRKELRVLFFSMKYFLLYNFPAIFHFLIFRNCPTPAIITQVHDIWSLSEWAKRIMLFFKLNNENVLIYFLSLKELSANSERTVKSRLILSSKECSPWLRIQKQQKLHTSGKLCFLNWPSLFWNLRVTTKTNNNNNNRINISKETK